MPEPKTQNPGISAATTTAVSPAVVADAPRKPASKVKNAAAIMATAAALQSAATQAAIPSQVKSQQELQEVSTAFLDGLPPTAPGLEAQPIEETTPTEDVTAASADEPEAQAASADEAATDAEVTDPGDDHADAAFAAESQTGPKWLHELMAKAKAGEPLPSWGPKRIAELVDKAVGKNAAIRDKETRIAELEEAVSALHTTEVPPHDVRGDFARVKDEAALKQQQDLAQRWIDWAAAVKPDEMDTVPNPTDPQGEAWTLHQVHEAMAQANARHRAAAAQLDYLSQEKPAKEEARKALPALFDKSSPEHKLAQQFLDKLPWLESKGDKEAILARLVLGEQVLQKRAKGVHTVDVSTAKPATTTTKTSAAKPAAVTTAPVRSGNAPVDITELRKRAATGDPAAHRQLAEAFLS